MYAIATQQLHCDAYDLYRRGQLADAAEVYQQILAADPRDYAALENLGNLQVISGRYAEAIGLLHRAIAVDPNVWKPHCNLGVAFNALTRWDEAEPEFRRSLELNPNHSEAHNCLAVALCGLAGERPPPIDHPGIALGSTPAEPFAIRVLDA